MITFCFITEGTKCFEIELNTHCFHAVIRKWFCYVHRVFKLDFCFFRFLETAFADIWSTTNKSLTVFTCSRNGIIHVILEKCSQNNFEKDDIINLILWIISRNIKSTRLIYFWVQQNDHNWPGSFISRILHLLLSVSTFTIKKLHYKYISIRKRMKLINTFKYICRDGLKYSRVAYMYLLN